jgi:dolichol-phosphate mannosyltransferase
MSKISVVVPVYFNELNLPSLLERLLALTQNVNFEFEYIFVDDGSGDNSYSILKEYASKDTRIKVIRLSRNFGSMVASLAGIRNATGDCLTVISADLQDPPEIICDMAHEWESGSMVVLAVRESRHDSLFVKLTSYLFYWCMRRFVISDMPAGGFDVFLIDKRVAQIVSKLQEKNTSLAGLILWLGFQKKIIYYTREKRNLGKSMWTFRKRFKFFIDSITAFSYFPLRLASAFGILLSLAGFVYIAWIFFVYFSMATTPTGWATLMVVVLLLGGVQLVTLGIIGEYIWRNFDETRKRPLYIVDESLGLEDPK